MKILFVCLGNICRSPLAEEVMRQIAKQQGVDKSLILDSAGLIGYHQGELPDSRMRMHASRRGYNLTHRSRPVTVDDFYEFDLVIGMDDSNISKLMNLAPGIEEEKKIVRLTDYCQQLMVDHVPDPYYGGASGFENVLDIVEDACSGLMAEVKNRL